MMKTKFFYLPRIAGSKFISETEQTVILENYNPNYMKLTGKTLTDRAGIYQITISLKDPTTCEWDNGSSEPIVLDWVVKDIIGPKNIGVMALPIPTVKGSLIVNGNEQTVEIENLNNIYMEISGTQTAKNVGTYRVTISLKYPEATKWADNSTDPVTLTWYIKRKKIAIPQQHGSLYYTGESQKPDFKDYDPSAVIFDTTKGEYTGIDAKEYNIVMSLRSNQYVWADGSSGHKLIKWEIKRKALKLKPRFFGDSFYFSGALQGPKIESYNPETMDLTGTPQAINIGSYHIDIQPKSNYCWDYKSDGSPDIETAAFDWTIVPIKIKKPTLTGSELTYNGSTQGPTNIYNQNSVEWSGTYQAINAGTYQATIRLLDNYTWDDGTRDPFTFFWSINPAKITELPSADKLNYTGKVLSPIWKNVELGEYTMYGDFSAILPGTYLVGFKPTKNYTWSDGTRTNKRIPWKILGSIDNITHTNFLDIIPTNLGGVTYNARAAV